MSRAFSMLFYKNNKNSKRLKSITNELKNGLNYGFIIDPSETPNVEIITVTRY